MFDDDLTLPEIMTVYNAARVAARNHARYKGRVMEIGRLNRALGRLLSKPENVNDYAVDVAGGKCPCIDAARTRFVCKHLAAEMIKTRIKEQRT